MKKAIKRLLKYVKWTTSTQISYAKIKNRVRPKSAQKLLTSLEIFEKYNLIERILGEGKKAVYKPTVMSDFVICDGIMVKYIGKDPVVRIPMGVREICAKKILPEGYLLWFIDPWIFVNEYSNIEVVLPPTTEKINNCAFEGLNLREFTMPDSVKEIGLGTLRGCAQLKKVKLSKSLKVIQQHTFCNCIKLEEVSLHRGIKEIMPYAFWGCQSLKTIIFEGTKDEWDTIRINEYNDELKNAKILFCE